MTECDEELFERIFGSDEHDSEPLFDKIDRLVGRFIYKTACEVYQSTNHEDSEDKADDDADNASVESFEEKLVATKENFDRIVDLFKQATKAKKDFQRNFRKWTPKCKEHIKLIREIAEAIHSDKFNCDIAKLVGAVLSTLGGIACAVPYLAPLAVAAGPLAAPLLLGGGIACGVGAGTMFGTHLTQTHLLKKQINEAKRTINEHEKNFSLMAHWFAMPEELKKILESVVSFDVIKEIGDDMKKFFEEVSRSKDMTIGDFKIRFKEVLKLCIPKMYKSGKVTAEFGDIFAPFVTTFIFIVCVIKGKNRIILDCVMINANLALSLLSILKLGLPAAQLAKGLSKGAAEVLDDALKTVSAKILIGISVLIDIISIVLNAIEIRKSPEPEQTKKLKEAADELEKLFLAIEIVYNETKSLEEEEPTTILLKSIPNDATQEDIKIAVRPYLPEGVWDLIKLERCKTKGNNWNVEVPTSHSDQLSLQTHLIIKEQRCEVIS